MVVHFIKFTTIFLFSQIQIYKLFSFNFFPAFFINFFGSQNCNEIKVKRAYHVLCDDCAHKLTCCGKCREQHEIVK